MFEGNFSSETLKNLLEGWSEILAFHCCQASFPNHSVHVIKINMMSIKFNVGSF